MDRSRLPDARSKTRSEIGHRVTVLFRVAFGTIPGLLTVIFMAAIAVVLPTPVKMVPVLLGAGVLSTLVQSRMNGPVNVAPIRLSAGNAEIPMRDQVVEVLEKSNARGISSVKSAHIDQIAGELQPSEIPQLASFVQEVFINGQRVPAANVLILVTNQRLLLISFIRGMLHVDLSFSDVALDRITAVSDLHRLRFSLQSATGEVEIRGSSKKWAVALQAELEGLVEQRQS
jgi:hypothetical protein